MQQKSSHRGGHPVREIAEPLRRTFAGMRRINFITRGRNPPRRICVHAYARTCTHGHARMHMHARTRTHAHARSSLRPSACTCTHARMHAHARMHMHVAPSTPPHAHIIFSITPPACHSSFRPTITMLRELSASCTSNHSTARRPGSAARRDMPAPELIGSTQQICTYVSQL